MSMDIHGSILNDSKTLKVAYVGHYLSTLNNNEMSKRQELPKRELKSGEHTNEDLLKTKTRKGLMFSEALVLQQQFSLANRTDYRRFGNADQREKYTPKEIADLKKGGNENFSNKILVKFW
jgi:hypothetical protein